MWITSRQEEKEAMNRLCAYYEKERTETTLNKILMSGDDVSYANIEKHAPTINEREKARVMSLYKNGDLS